MEKISDERLQEISTTGLSFRLALASFHEQQSLARELLESRRVLRAILNERGESRYYSERNANREAIRRVLGEIE